MISPFYFFSLLIALILFVYYFVEYEYNNLKFVDPVLRRFIPVIYRWQRALWKICCSSRVEFRAMCPCFRRKPGPNFEPSFASLANWNFDGSDRILLINWKIENKVVSFLFPLFPPPPLFYCHFLREINFVSFLATKLEEKLARFETCLVLLETELKIGNLNTKIIIKIEININSKLISFY